MKDKEKQIEEMFNYLRECSNNAWAKGFDYAEIDDEKLREFLALFPEDSVVLSRKEYEKVKHVLKYEPEEAIIRLEDLTKNERLYSPHMFCSLGGCSGVGKGCNRTCKESWIVIERKETAEKILEEIKNYLVINSIPEMFSEDEFIINLSLDECYRKLNELAKDFGVEIKD